MVACTDVAFGSLQASPQRAQNKSAHEERSGKEVMTPRGSKRSSGSTGDVHLPSEKKRKKQEAQWDKRLVEPLSREEQECEGETAMEKLCDSYKEWEKCGKMVRLSSSCAVSRSVGK